MSNKKNKNGGSLSYKTLKRRAERHNRKKLTPEKLQRLKKLGVIK